MDTTIASKALVLAGALTVALLGAALVAAPGRATGGPEPTESAGKAGAVWGADYFPNIELTTHDGRTVRFFDDLVKDKVVAINFI